MAIDELLDEHEQGERVRGWLRQNGGGMVGGVLLGLALIGGWQWWQKRQDNLRAQAGERYEAVTTALGNSPKDLTKPATQVAALKDSSYGALAALQLARAQADAGQRDAAIATLRGARADASGFEEIVDQRLARLLIDAGKPNEALPLLASGKDAGTLEVRGDAELAAGQRDAARASYQKAITMADEGSPQRRLLELKLSDAGGAPTGTSAKPEAKS